LRTLIETKLDPAERRDFDADGYTVEDTGDVLRRLAVMRKAYGKQMRDGFKTKTRVLSLMSALEINSGTRAHSRTSYSNATAAIVSRLSSGLQPIAKSGSQERPRGDRR
jgi:hypothetical protein